MGKKSYKRVSIEHRRTIEAGPSNSDTMSDMARATGFDASTVRREILRNRRHDICTSTRHRIRNDLRIK